MKRNFLVLISSILLIMGCKDIQESQQLPMETPIVTLQPDPTDKVVTPKDGGTLNLSMRLPKTLNPILNEDATVDKILQLLFEPLFMLDDTLKPTPNIAESIVFSSDGLNAVITLRANMKWSNGTKITASDIKFTLDTIEIASEKSIYKDVIRNIANYEVIGDLSIKIFFKEAYMGSEYTFCFPIIPQNYYKSEINPASTKNMVPVGNGAFEFVVYNNVKNMVLKRSNEYFKKPAYIDEVNVIITSDYETDISCFEQSITDAIDISISTWGEYHGHKNTKTNEFPISYYDFIGFNYNNILLQNKNVREAVATAIDVDNIVSTIYLDRATRAYTPINPVSWVHESDVKKFNYDLENSKNIFSNFENVSFTILVNEENDERVKIATILHENLKKIGVTTTVVSVNFDEFMKRIYKQDFDLFIGGLNLSVIPDLSPVFSTNAEMLTEEGLTSERGFLQYESPELSNMLYTTARLTDEIPIKNSLSNIQKFLANEVICVSICFRKSEILTDQKVYGDISPVMNHVYRNINQWYIDTISTSN